MNTSNLLAFDYTSRNEFPYKLSNVCLSSLVTYSNWCLNYLGWYIDSIHVFILWFSSLLQISTDVSWYDQKKVDGVVADLTITSDRLKLVDFTQPYIQSSLQMIAPLKSEPNIDFWILLAPFSTGLWVSILGMFVLTIICIFIVEHCGRSDGESWKATLSRSFW